MSNTKARVIKSLENLSEELRDLIKKQYPTGYQGSISRIMNAKKEPIFVFPLETDDAVILVKVPATKNSDGGYDFESKPEKEFDNSKDDDDFGDGDSSSEEVGDSDYDEDGGKGGGREASYDPDFDA